MVWCNNPPSTAWCCKRFLLRISILTRDIDIANLSVCPSVRLLRSGIVWKRLNVLSYFFSPYGSPIILVYHHQTSLRNSDGVPLLGTKYRWDINTSQFWTNNSLYLTDDTRQCRSYCGRQIGTRMRSIKWCHFQWPRMNLTLFSRLHHSLTLSISQMATDTAIVTVEGE